MKKNIRTFSSKIFVAIIVFIVVIIGAVFAMFYFSILKTEGEVTTVLKNMKSEINNISSGSLSDNYDEMMNYIVDGQTSAIEYAMERHRSDLNYLANVIEDAYKIDAKAVYPVGLPDIKKEGKVSAQLFYENGVNINNSEIQDEINTLSVIQREIVYSVNESIGRPRCYLETESGFAFIADKTPSDKYDEDGNLKPIEFRTTDWYKNAIEADEMYVSDIIEDRLTGKKTIVLSEPFFDKTGKKRGVVCFDLYIDGITDSSLAIKNSNIYDIIIIDRNNNIVVNTSEYANTDEVEFPKIAMELVKEAREKGKGIKDFKTIRNEFVVYYNKLNIDGWMLFVALKYSAIKKNVDDANYVLDAINNDVYQRIKDYSNDAMHIIIFISLILLLLSFLLTKFIANMLMVPLNEFTKSISNVDASDLKPVEVVDSSAELYTLSTTYNGMIEKMKDYVDNIEEITAEKESMKTELKVAKKIQQDMLPKEFKKISNRKDIDIYGINIPEIEVGGDFYNYILVGNKLILIIADVSGSGVPAGLFMAKTNSLLNNAISWTTNPRTIVSYVNHALNNNNTENYFVTIALYTIDLKTRHVISVNAGHEDPIIVKNDGEVQVYREKRAAFIGVTENLKFDENEFDLEEGDTLFLYTDGVIEGINKNEELYGGKRLIDVIEKNSNKALPELAKAIKTDIDEFTKGMEQYDDITMLALRINKRDSNYRQELVNQYETTFVGSYDMIEDIGEFLNDKLLDAYNGNDEKFKKYMNKFEVCIEEIVVNIIDYAYKNGEEKIVKVTLEVDKNDDKVTVSFIDNGKEFDPTLADEPNILKDVKARKLGGLGIYITRKFMDLMNYEYINGQNVLTILKYL